MTWLMLTMLTSIHPGGMHYAIFAKNKNFVTRGLSPSEYHKSFGDNGSSSSNSASKRKVNLYMSPFSSKNKLPSEPAGAESGGAAEGSSQA